VWKWLRQQSKNFYTAGFDALVKRWDKCINVGGGCAEKYMFFPDLNITCPNVQDNMGILQIPYDNYVSTTAPLHPTCSPIKWEIPHVNIQEFITSYPPCKDADQSDQCTGEITNRCIHIF
jgi:hypothetical protein